MSRAGPRRPGRAARLVERGGARLGNGEWERGGAGRGPPAEVSRGRAGAECGGGGGGEIWVRVEELVFVWKEAEAQEDQGAAA